MITDIFNTSLVKCYHQYPHPSTEYRSVTLTPVVMKPFEHHVLDPLLDPPQFSYRADRSVDDTVNMALHYILMLQDSP